MANSPGMLEPKIGDPFLFCLAPTIVTNLFAAFTAPYDDDQAIFFLDRNYYKYSSYREGKMGKTSVFEERNALIWSLIDEAGKVIPGGAERMRKTFAKEITAPPSNRVVHLQWQTYTNPAGWMRDVPKESTNTHRNEK